MTSLLYRSISGQTRLYKETLSQEDQQSQLIWTSEISQTLDHQRDSIHQLIWGHQHTYSRGLLGLCSFRDDVPNPQETGVPREFRGLGGGGYAHGDTRVGRRYGMWNSWRVDWGRSNNIKCVININLKNLIYEEVSKWVLSMLFWFLELWKWQLLQYEYGRFPKTDVLSTRSQILWLPWWSVKPLESMSWWMEEVGH